MPLTIYTGSAKSVDTHVERLCHLSGHVCVVVIPPRHARAKSLTPFDSVPLGRSHTHRHPGGVSIGPTSLPSHQSPVYTTQLSRGQAGVFSPGRAIFRRVSQACDGRYGMKCGHGSDLRQTPLCV